MNHGDPIAPVLVGIVVIILAARVGGHFFELAKLTAVLGELMVGVLLGNLTLMGFDGFEFLKVDYARHQMLDLRDYQHLAGVTIDHLARIGVILLLFQVGLETSIADMRKVGWSALLVAVIGVIVPTALGWASGRFVLPDHHWPVHMFIGATLCATSVGITARVLHNLGHSQTVEARIILGAAVIDDILGLIVLAVAQGVIASISIAASGGDSSFGAGAVLLIAAKAGGFLLIALLLGQFISRRIFVAASFLRGQGLLVVSALAICFGFAWTANAAGLATIVGAFAAGLILEKVHYRELAARGEEHQLEELLKPISNLLVPIFFVEMGLHVDLRSFADLSVLGVAGVLIVVAVIGKLACGLGVLDKSVSRWSVGLGMVPRGEVGLIFAAVGLELHIGSERVIDASTYSALVVVVIVTTLLTPPLLKWSLERSGRAPSDPMN